MLPKRRTPQQYPFAFEPTRGQMTMKAAAWVAAAIVLIAALVLLVYNVGISAGVRLK